jgi:PP-loop superfamily ATP-utilizing enzyme
MDKKAIVVWFSCGAASAVAAKKTIELYGSTHTIRVVNNPIKEEDIDNLRFLKDVEKWLGIEIEFAVNSKYPNCSTVEVWEKKQYMSGVAGAPCTGELKKKARQEWEKNNHYDFLVMGFTVDEISRHNGFKNRERENILPVLIDLKLTKNDCFKIIQEADIELPRIYKMGYPNANCIGCVKATSPTYWSHVKKMHPTIFNERAEQSRRIGARLVRYKNKRIFLDELPEGAKGRSMKNMNIECGIFCEEAI